VSLTRWRGYGATRRATSRSPTAGRLLGGFALVSLTLAFVLAAVALAAFTGTLAARAERDETTRPAALVALRSKWHRDVRLARSDHRTSHRSPRGDVSNWIRGTGVAAFKAVRR